MPLGSRLGPLRALLGGLWTQKKHLSCSVAVALYCHCRCSFCCFCCCYNCYSLLLLRKRSVYIYLERRFAKHGYAFYALKYLFFLTQSAFFETGLYIVRMLESQGMKTSWGTLSSVHCASWTGGVYFWCFFIAVEWVALRLPVFFCDAVLVLPDGCRTSFCSRYFRPPSLSQALIFSGAPNFSALVTQSFALRMRLADVFCRLQVPLASSLMIAKRVSSYICVSAFGQVQWAEEHHCVRNFFRSRTEGISVHTLIARPLSGCFSFLAACVTSWSVICLTAFFSRTGSCPVQFEQFWSILKQFWSILKYLEAF